MRAAYRYWSWLVFLAVVLQVGFAGYGAFSVVNDVDDAGSVDEDMLVCVLEGGFQAGERTLRDAGRSEIVTENREAFQQVLRERFVSTVEELTGRKVRAFVSGVDTETEVSTELFLFEPAVELGDEHEAVHAWADQTKRRTRELREEQVALREEHARLRRSPS